MVAQEELASFAGQLKSATSNREALQLMQTWQETFSPQFLGRAFNGTPEDDVPVLVSLAEKGYAGHDTLVRRCRARST